MKVMIIIPAYNEEESISRVVDDIIANYPQYDYIVVNDGSKDQTVRVCRENQYHLLNLSVNCGLEGAFQAGMKYADRTDCDFAIQLDGDGQHSPEFIKPMLEEFQKKEHLDIIIGSRFVKEKKPFTLRMLGSNIISLAIFLTTHKSIKDPTSGMRMYNRRMIHLCAERMSFGPEPDTIAYLLRCGARIGEVQVEMSERMAGESYLNFSSSMKYMLRMCLSIFFVQWFRRKEKITK